MDEKQSEINKLQSDAHSLKKACDDEVRIRVCVCVCVCVCAWGLLCTHHLNPNACMRTRARVCPTWPDVCAMLVSLRVQVLSYQRRMEEMQLDFTQMLRDTLDKMHDRLACVPGLT